MELTERGCSIRFIGPPLALASNFLWKPDTSRRWKTIQVCSPRESQIFSAQILVPSICSPIDLLQCALWLVEGSEENPNSFYRWAGFSRKLRCENLSDLTGYCSNCRFCRNPKIYSDWPVQKLRFIHNALLLVYSKYSPRVGFFFLIGPFQCAV